MAMHDLDLLSDDNVAKYREKGEHRWHRRFTVYDEERDMVDLEAVREIPNPRAPFVRMCNYYDFVAAVNEFLER